MLSSNSLNGHLSLIEIKDFIDDIMGCDCLIDRTEYDTVRCNLGSGILWTSDFDMLKSFFDVKAVISEGDNLAILIRNINLL